MVRTAELRRMLEEAQEALERVALHKQARGAIERTAYGMSRAPGSPSGGFDPVGRQIMHMVHPRDSEVAMLMAEHARWAQRETLKALHLASTDAARAVDAASHANEAALEALRRPGAPFPVYGERPLPGEPWIAGSQDAVRHRHGASKDLTPQDIGGTAA